MLPNSSPSQMPDPAALPPVSTTAAPVAAPQTPLPPAPPQTVAPAGADIVAQAKQVFQQYQGNPYRQSEALGQLKSQYLTERFHINPNPGQK